MVLMDASIFFSFLSEILPAFDQVDLKYVIEDSTAPGEQSESNIWMASLMGDSLFFFFF